MRERKIITSDGRDITHAGWRTIPTFPKYEMTVDGDIRNRQTHKLLTETENNRGAWYYSLWGNDGKCYKRAYGPLHKLTFPEFQE